MFANPLNLTINASVYSGDGGMPTQVLEEFILTAFISNTQGGLLSAYVSLNGGLGLTLDANGKPPALDGRRPDDGGSGIARLPPESYGFLVFGGQPQRACGA